MAAENIHTPAAALGLLARDEASTVRSAVAANPSTPQEVLLLMVVDVEAKGARWGWTQIAGRDDLSPAVLAAFANLDLKNAARFAHEISDPVRHGYWPRRIRPEILMMLASKPDSREGLRFPTASIQQSIAELGHGLNEPMMLQIAQLGDTPAHRTLVDKVGPLMPEAVAQVLARRSDDTYVLDRLLIFLELPKEDKQEIRKRLEGRPEWQKQQALLRKTRDEARIVDSQGRVLQEAALRPGVADSPAETAFWDAYRKAIPSELTGLVAQHNVGRYRLDFAIPHRRMGIEIDGLQYHSSQESIIKDRRRQRELEQQGWRIVRFAAKEVFDNADECVRQAAQWAASV
jgi:very-short-patch-repair endonuclease